MPKKATIARARADAKHGKSASTQAGEFVRDKTHELKHGDKAVKSRKQAIAIGLSEARRSGVKLSPPKKGKTSAATRRKAQKDVARGQGKRKVNPKRSQAAKKAARTRKRRG
jgi:hypothetical protein